MFLLKLLLKTLLLPIYLLVLFITFMINLASSMAGALAILFFILMTLMMVFLGFQHDWVGVLGFLAFSFVVFVAGCGVALVNGLLIIASEKISRLMVS